MSPKKSNTNSSEKEEIEKLESEMEQMAQKIKVLRSNTPHHLITALNSLLLAKRPQLPNLDVGIQVESDASVEVQATIEKAVSLKRKISSNISSMAVLVERTNKCISELDSVNSLDDIIPPPFKRKTTY